MARTQSAPKRERPLKSKRRPKLASASVSKPAAKDRKAVFLAKLEANLANEDASRQDRLVDEFRDLILRP